MAQETVSGVFSIAMRMSAPFIVVGLVFYFGLGLLNKLMPQMQIFFISAPVGIAIGILLLYALLIAIMNKYLAHFTEAIGKFTGVGQPAGGRRNVASAGGLITFNTSGHPVPFSRGGGFRGNNV
ncbi:flagellar biosynthetic protein FliR [Pannonibacter sp. Pt2-lr]